MCSFKVLLALFAVLTVSYAQGLGGILGGDGLLGGVLGNDGLLGGVLGGGSSGGSNGGSNGGLGGLTGILHELQITVQNLLDSLTTTDLPGGQDTDALQQLLERIQKLLAALLGGSTVSVPVSVPTPSVPLPI